MVDTRSNMQLADLNYKPHGGKSLRIIIDCAIGAQFYPPPGSLHFQQLRLGHFHETNHINCDKNKTSEIENTTISSAHNRTKKSCADQI